MINGLVKLFDVPGTVVSAEHYGAGHINDTYRIATIAEGERRIDYILQRINHHIFRDVGHQQPATRLRKPHGVFSGAGAEHQAQKDEYRHVGGGHRRHLRVAQLTDHEGVDEPQGEGDEILHGNGQAQTPDLPVKGFAGLR